MKIDKSTVERLANLSKLDFSEKEKLEMVEDFKKMVGFVDTLQEVNGAFSIIAFINDKMIIARDPNGYRPLCIGKFETTRYESAGYSDSRRYDYFQS